MISQTIEYALRAMVYVAGLDPNTAVTCETIAVYTKVPQGYLSKVLRDLVLANLLNSQRGPNGGFALAQPADQISMLDVVNAVDPIDRLRSCPLGNPAHVSLCPLHKNLDSAIAVIEKSLASTSIANVLQSTAQPRECPALEPGLHPTRNRTRLKAR